MGLEGLLLGDADHGPHFDLEKKNSKPLGAPVSSSHQSCPSHELMAVEDRQEEKGTVKPH